MRISTRVAVAAALLTAVFAAHAEWYDAQGQKRAGYPPGGIDYDAPQYQVPQIDTGFSARSYRSGNDVITTGQDNGERFRCRSRNSFGHVVTTCD